MIVVYMLVNISYMAVLGVAGILESQAVALVCNYVQLCLELFLKSLGASWIPKVTFQTSISEGGFCILTNKKNGFFFLQSMGHTYLGSMAWITSVFVAVSAFGSATCTAFACSR